MPKRKNEVVKQVKEASRTKIGKLPKQQIIKNKKKDNIWDGYRDVRKWEGGE